MKNKIEPGQCYQFEDNVYMVVDTYYNRKNEWIMQDTISKLSTVWTTEKVLSCFRPHQNY